MITSGNNALQKTTSYKVVLPFYLYAAAAFLLSCILLFFSGSAFQLHYFNPAALAITHLMALGWGTMIILGASHQLVPVLIEGKLHSNVLAYLSFGFAAIGIPLLVYGFYVFDMGFPAQAGAIIVNLAVISYLINLSLSISRSGKKSVYGAFILAAISWLLLTTLAGGLLVFNFNYQLLSSNSLTYLPLHAHMGIAGWFLLLVCGVGSRLIPMFLISKYSNEKKLWAIFGSINLGLVLFILSALCTHHEIPAIIPTLLTGTGMLLFGHYCFKAYQQRIRKKTDNPVKISLLSVAMILLPLMVLMLIIALLPVAGEQNKLVLLYGFCIFFGWITAIILGMTFKTLPFIIWNKVYHLRPFKGKKPNPADLYSGRQFNGMAISYLTGFVLFCLGLIFTISLLLKTGAAFLICAAFLYNLNIIKTVLHKPAEI